MWLQAKLPAKLLLLGEGRGAGRHSQSRTELPWTQRSQTRGDSEGWRLLLWCGGSEPPQPYLHLSSPCMIHPLTAVVRPLGCGDNSLSTVDPWGKEPLESHICITQTSDRKLGWHSLRAIVPALVGTPSSARPHNGQLGWVSWVSCPAAASYKRPFKPPDFYARSTYTIKLFLKQLNCLQVLCKKPNLFEEKICMWKGNPISTRNSDFSQTKPPHPKKLKIKWAPTSLCLFTTWIKVWTNSNS